MNNSDRKENESRQTVYLYIGRVAELCKNKIVPEYTSEELTRITNERVADEKRAAYGLLNYAVKRHYGKKNSGYAGWWRTEAGKPVSPCCQLSLSHAGGLVAVAVSDAPVGIDIEPIDARDFDRIAKRILTDAEKRIHSRLPYEERTRYFLSIWTKCEAMYKLTGDHTAFDPLAADEGPHTVRGYSVTDGLRRYVLSLATDNPAEIRTKSVSLDLTLTDD